VTDAQTHVENSNSVQHSDSTLKLQNTDAKSSISSLSDVNADPAAEGCHIGLSLTHGIERFDKLESVPEDAKESEDELEMPNIVRKSSSSYTAATKSENDLRFKESQEPPETHHIESMQI
jgi:hypothetical protein